jgi:general secretion pathway protein E
MMSAQMTLMNRCGSCREQAGEYEIMTAVQTPQKLEKILVEQGWLDDVEGQRLVKLWSGQSSDVSFSRFLVELGAAAESEVGAALAELHQLTLVRGKDYGPVESLDGKISARFLQEHRAVPIGEEGETIILAVADPDNDFTPQAVAVACDRPVACRVGLSSEIDAAIERYFGAGRTQIEQIVERAGLPAGEVGGELEAQQLKDLASEAPVVKLVNLFFRTAHEIGASDIHLERFEGALKLRYRVDGVLQEAESPPAQLASAVVSRLKLMAKLNIAERRLPQDGRIRLRQEGRDVDIRISTVPTMHGESVVMRVLNRDDVTLDLASLGFDTSSGDVMRELLKAPHGMILVTGPTGSGKTTTLYTALHMLNSPDRKVITVEDPVEYQLEGVNQIPVRPSIDLTFSNALRAIVRQDPDVIMVGEMRDTETARICVQSALTGHLVLSTVHTNDAAGCVTRLLEMGVENYLLTSTLNAVVGQRLVRRLCMQYRESYRPLPAVAKRLNVGEDFDTKDIVLYRPKGCVACGHTGYRGRIAILELLVMDDTLRTLVLESADARQIDKAARAAGMKSMAMDGALKALAGETSIEEVIRVTQDD